MTDCFHSVRPYLCFFFNSILRFNKSATGIIIYLSVCLSVFLSVLSMQLNYCPIILFVSVVILRRLSFVTDTFSILTDTFSILTYTFSILTEVSEVSPKL